MTEGRTSIPPAELPCSRCGATPNDGLTEGCPECEGILQGSPPSDVLLPPYARRLDVRAARAAFAAGTLGTVGDDVAREDAERYVVARDANRDDANVMHDECDCLSRNLAALVSDPPHLQGHAASCPKREAEAIRQSRLRRWQAIR
jgi:hypothetical protein